MHPEDNVNLFLSVDRQPKTEYSVIACFKAEHSALCLELCTRVVPFMIERCGPNAEAPFLREFVAEQKEAFVTTPTGIKSRADLAVETHEKDYENLGDVPVEEDPSHRVLIADVQLHVPRAHRSRTLFKMKDESAATSLKEAEEHAATHGSLLQQVTTVALPDDDNFDLASELSTLKCSSIEEWPNCPELQEPSPNPDGSPFDAFVTQLHRILYQLQDALFAPSA